MLISQLRIGSKVDMWSYDSSVARNLPFHLLFNYFEKNLSLSIFHSKTKWSIYYTLLKSIEIFGTLQVVCLKKVFWFRFLGKPQGSLMFRNS